jgi:hypothetical protein
MNGGGGEGVSWRSVALGWVVAVLVGAVVSPTLRTLYGLVVEPPLERGEFTVTIVVISLVSGFLAYLVGGCVAGRSARYSGGLNGAMTAVFGLILGVILAAILAVFGVIFPEGVAIPPACFGLIGEGLLAGLILFLVNLFGGYVGGKLGEPLNRGSGAMGS